MANRAYNYILSIFIAAAGTALFHIALAQEGAAEGIISRPTVEYKSGSLRDPFQPPMEKKEKITVHEVLEKQEKKIGLVQPGSDVGNLKVQGIIWGGRIPQAIINDQVLSVGDTIQGAEILNIDKNGITLSSDGLLGNLAVSGEDLVSTGNDAPVEPPIAARLPGLMEKP